MKTTNIAVTTARASLLSSATTWANTKGAGLWDPVTLKVKNSGVTPVRIGGSDLSTVAGVGYPVSSGTSWSMLVSYKSEAVFVITSASTSNVDVMADRQ